MQAIAVADDSAFSVTADIGSSGKAQGMVVQVEGLTTESVAVQGTLDGETWYPIAGISVGTTTPNTQIASMDADGFYRFNVSGLKMVRFVKTGASESVTVLADIYRTAA